MLSYYCLMSCFKLLYKFECSLFWVLPKCWSWKPSERPVWLWDKLLIVLWNWLRLSWITLLLSEDDFLDLSMLISRWYICSWRSILRLLESLMFILFYWCTIIVIKIHKCYKLNIKFTSRFDFEVWLFNFFV